MNSFFLHDVASSTYKDLHARICALEKIQTVCDQEDLFSLYALFLAALAQGENLALIDADLSIQERHRLSDVGGQEVSNVFYGGAASFDELHSKIMSSTSFVTLHTSGTTGQPKAVRHKVSALLEQAKVSDRHWRDCWGLAFNPTHMAGIQVFLQAFSNKNTVVNVFGKSRNEIISRIQEHSVTHLSATPTFYRLLLPADFALNGVRRISIGGEKSGVDLYAKLARIFPNAKLTNIYASTEAGSLLASHGEYFSIPDSLKERVKVEDGQLLVSMALLGQLAENPSEEWYRTGDLVAYSELNHAHFKFVGRLNEMINVGGYKVNPQEIEDVCLRYEGISSCIISSRSNSVLGNMLVCEVSLIQKDGFDIDAFRAFLRSELQDFKVPRIIKVIEQADTTRTGKLRRR